MKNSIIHISDWLAMKPYERQQKSDFFYLNLSNNIKKTIYKNKYFDELMECVADEDIKDLSCFIASYLEDIVSGTNIWNTFVRNHEKLYNKKLPFYKTDEYFDNEINPEDVAFLMWYFLSDIFDNEFISPTEPFILNISFDIYNELDKVYENAPENDFLKEYFTLKTTNNFFKVRQFIEKMSESYLFILNTSMDIENRVEEINEHISKKKLPNDYIKQLLYESQMEYISNYTTRFLAMSYKDWAAEVLGEKHPMYHDIKNISKRISGNFLYEGKEKDYYIFEHIATDEKFKVKRDSVDFKGEEKMILYTSIICWKDEWWVSGIISASKFDANRILEEKEMIENRLVIDSLKNDKIEIQNNLDKMKEVFLKFNNNSLITFLNGKYMNKFISDFNHFYNSSLNLSKTEIKEAKKRSRKKGIEPNLNKKNLKDDDNNNYTLFFNPKSGIEMFFNVENAFPDKNNPFFTEEEREVEALYILTSKKISKEMTDYWFDNYSKKTEVFNESDYNILKINYDFLMRFWKRKEYHTIPKMTFV